MSAIARGYQLRYEICYLFRLNDTGSYICRVHNYLKKLEEVQWTSRCEVYVEESLHRHIDKMAIHDNTTNNRKDIFQPAFFKELILTVFFHI